MRRFLCWSKLKNWNRMVFVYADRNTVSTFFKKFQIFESDKKRVD